MWVQMMHWHVWKYHIKFQQILGSRRSVLGSLAPRPLVLGSRGATLGNWVTQFSFENSASWCGPMLLTPRAIAWNPIRRPSWSRKNARSFTSGVYMTSCWPRESRGTGSGSKSCGWGCSWSLVTRAGANATSLACHPESSKKTNLPELICKFLVNF